MINIEIDKNWHNFKNLSRDIKNFFQESNEIITEKRNIIKIVEYNSRKVVVKSFKIPNLINRFAYRFVRASKAKRSFLNAKKLIELGIDTPTPISYIEFFTPLFSESFYISTYFDYDFEIRDVFKDESFEKRDEILTEFVKFSYSLHQKGVYHLDYSPGNILVKKRGDKYHFTIVDVNRMKFIKFDNRMRFKNLSRLSTTEHDLKTIATKYASIANIDEKYAIELLSFYHKKHQQYLEKKRELKKIKFF